MKNAYFGILLTLLILLGLGAFISGGAMIIDPSGESLTLPGSILEYTPFSNFLVPGIILFLIFGLIPLLLVWPLLKQPYNRFFEGLNILTDMHWAWTYVIYIGFGLIIWIQVQMQMIQDVFWLHDLYTYWAVFMLSLALMPGVRKRFKKV